MSLSTHWKSLSRLNRTRILVGVYAVTFVILAAGTPILLFAA